MTPEERIEHDNSQSLLLPKDKLRSLCDDYITGKDVAVIVRKYNISKEAVLQIARQYFLSTARSKFAKGLREASQAVGRQKAAKELIEDAEYQAHKSTVKKKILDMLDLAIEMTHERMADSEFRPKTTGEAFNSIAKLADIYSRITEEGEIKPAAIEITITGVNPALPQTREAVEIRLIGTGPADCLPESESTGNSLPYTNQEQEIESWSADEDLEKPSSSSEPASEPSKSPEQ